MNVHLDLKSKNARLNLPHSQLLDGAMDEPARSGNTP